MSSTTSVPYLGSRISIVSKSEIRYEGILYTVDTKQATIALAKVRCLGTEGRPTEKPIPIKDEIYEYIIFKAADIKDLVVCETPRPIPQLHGNLPYDPAIVQASQLCEHEPVQRPGSNGSSSAALIGASRPRTGFGGSSSVTTSRASSRSSHTGSPTADTAVQTESIGSDTAVPPPIQPLQTAAIGRRAPLLRTPDRFGADHDVGVNNTPIAATRPPNGNRTGHVSFSLEDNQVITESRQNGTGTGTGGGFQQYRQRGRGGDSGGGFSNFRYTSPRVGRGGFARVNRSFDSSVYGSGGDYFQNHPIGGYGRGSFLNASFDEALRGLNAGMRGSGPFPVFGRGRGRVQGLRGFRAFGGLNNFNSGGIYGRGGSYGGLGQQGRMQSQQQQRRPQADPNEPGSGRMTMPKEPLLKFESDYDFEEANTQFAETVKEICEELAGAAIAAANDSTQPSTDPVTEATKEADKTPSEPAVPNGGAESDASSVSDAAVKVITTSAADRDQSSSAVDSQQSSLATEEAYYNKDKSFFDRISCEAIEKADGKFTGLTRQKERELNQETFGVAWARYMPPANRIRGRGLLAFRGRGMAWRWYSGVRADGQQNLRGYRGRWVPAV